jgi:ATP-dependent RNA helicase DeaD
MTHESAAEMGKAFQRFSDLNISSELKKGIKELGYVTPTDFQNGVFINVQNGRNVAGEGQSSYGKSLAFALPILAKLVTEPRNLQALIICETALLADLAVKEYRALSRHLGITVGQSAIVDAEAPPHLVVLSVDELAKFDFARFSDSLHLMFFDGLSTKNAEAALLRVSPYLTAHVQVLLFGDMTVTVFKNNAKDVVDNAAFISNNDQPKIATPAKHVYLQAKEAEPKPRALLAALEILKPKSALVTCSESSECDLLARYLSRYGYRTRIVSEDNRQNLADILKDMQPDRFEVVICQTSLLSGVSLEHVAYMFNYDMFDRPQVYEQSTQFFKQAPGLTRHIVNILTSRELGLLGPIKAQCQIDFSEIPLPKEDEIMDLAATRIRQALLKDASEIELSQFSVLAKKIVEDPEAELIIPLLLRNYFLRLEKPRSENEGRDSRDKDRPRGGRSTYDRRRPERGERSDRGERSERHERSERSERSERNEQPDRPSERHPRDRDLGPGREEKDAEDHSPRSLGGSDEGITRLYITLGRKDGLFDLASLAQYLSDKSGVDLGHFSGSGMIRDTSAHIEVDDDVAEDIIKALHHSPRPAQEGMENPEEPNLVICEKARQTAPRHNRRPMQRRRPPRRF